jgi:F-type H+-transporting ATPase subunit b
MFQLKVDQAGPADGLGHAPHLVLVQETQPESAEGAGTATPPEHEKSGGMPQLEFADFPPQLIWLTIAFVLLLILMSKVALPRVASAIEQRDARIKGDLDRAERVKIDADAALAAYQKTMTDARAKAQAELRQAQAAVAAETTQRESAFAQQLAQRTKAAEDSIAAAKARAVAELRGVGAEVTGNVLRKVAGLSPPAAQIETAVAAAMTER